LILVWGSDEDDGDGQSSRKKTWGRKMRGGKQGLFEADLQRHHTTPEQQHFE
jgi:hypothetical protein